MEGAALLACRSFGPMRRAAMMACLSVCLFVVLCAGGGNGQALETRSSPGSSVKKLERLAAIARRASPHLACNALHCMLRLQRALRTVRASRCMARASCGRVCTPLFLRRSAACEGPPEFGTYTYTTTRRCTACSACAVGGSRLALQRRWAAAWIKRAVLCVRRSSPSVSLGARMPEVQQRVCVYAAPWEGHVKQRVLVIVCNVLVHGASGAAMPASMGILHVQGKRTKKLSKAP